MTSWTERMWADAEPIYTAILKHPFLTGLTAASLPPDRFAYYVAQDAHYLRDYARALAVVGAKAPTHAAAGMLGLDPAELDQVPVSPTTLSYTSYLLATVYGGSFAEGLAAVLPCYWIYARVGAALLERGSSDPRYQRWIDTYAGEEFTATVAEVLAFADLIGQDLSEAEESRAGKHFTVTARYEWMFWDAAWRVEQWPVS